MAFADKVMGQCFNLNYSNCITLNSSLTISANNGFDSFWTIIDPNGVPITPSFPANYFTNYTFPLSQTGTYTVTADQSLTSGSSCGLETFYITVNLSNFSISPISITNPCEGQTINLQNQINTSNISVLPLQYSFSIGGNQILNPTNYTLQAGISVIDVVVIDGSGCTDSTTLNINATTNAIGIPIYTILDADSNQNIIKPCGSTNLTFNIQNPDPSFTYSWYVQGNTNIGTSFIQSINATTSNPGYIPVTLSVYDPLSGCNVDFYDTIVSVGLGMQIGAGMQTDIVPLCVGNINLLWVENGSNPILEMGPGDSIYWEISCDSSIVDSSSWGHLDIQNYIVSHPFIANEQIAGYPATFPSNSCGCNEPGITNQFKIKAQLTSACLTNTTTIAVWKTVNDPIQANLNINPNPICVGTEVSFGNLSQSGCNGNSFDSNEDTLWYYWDFGDCSPIVESFAVLPNDTFPDMTHTYNQPGVYYVELLAKSYCGADSIIDSVTVLPGPNQVSFTVNDSLLCPTCPISICLGDTISVFSEISADPDTIRIDTCSVSPLVIDTINVPAGDTNFTYIWCFDWNTINNSCGPGSQITTTTADTIDFLYAECGTHNISLDVIDGNGCRVSYDPPVIVSAPPTALFSSTTVCIPDATDLIDLSTPGYCIGDSTGDGPPIEQWDWEFGDGSSDTSIFFPHPYSIPHLYNAPCINTVSENYNVTLTVTDTLGCVDDTIIPVTVLCEQIADFNDNGFCFLDGNGNISSQTIVNTSTPLDPTNTNPNYVVWTVYDPPSNPITYNLINLTHQFSGPGNYKVVMEINGQFSNPPTICSGSDSAWINVWGNPTATAITTDVSCNGGNNGTASLTLSGGTGTLSTNWFGQNPNALSAGTYNYQITDVNGCLFNGSVTINEPSAITATAITTDVSCNGGNNGTASLTLSGGTGTLSTNWFGQNPNALSAGTYNYQITDVNGCLFNGSVTINEPIIITGFDTDTACGSHLWQGTNYSSSGIFTSTLIASNGCDSIATLDLTIANLLAVSAPTPALQVLCQNATIQNLTVTASGGIGTYQYQWYENTTNSNIGGTAATGTGANSDTYTPQNTIVSTTYYYCVITQNGGQGCEVTSTTAEVQIVPGPSFTTQPQNDIVCIGANISMNITYINGTGTPQYQWYENTINNNTGGTIATGTGANTNTYTPQTATAGTTYYYCELNLPTGGCSVIASNTAEIIVNPDPTIDTQPLSTDTICLGGTINIPLEVSYTIGTGVGTVSYQWYSNTINSNTGGTVIPSATNATFTPNTSSLIIGAYYYYAIISFSGNDCDDATSNVAHIQIINDPIVSAPTPALQVLCQNATIQNLTVTASGGIGTYQYQWYENTTNSNIGGTAATGTGANSDTYTPQNTIVSTTYYYCVITQNGGQGCEVTSTTAEVQIVPGPSFTTQPQNDIVCIGANISMNITYINGTGTPQYQWYENTINNNTGGTIATGTGANTNTYTPQTATAGTTYYYCELNLPTGGCSVIASNTAEIIVNPDPTIDTQPLSTDTICLGGTINIPLEVSYTIGTGVGTVSYQWYSNTINSNTGGTVIPSATNATFTPNTSSLIIGAYYYYAIISFSGNDCDDATSNVAHIQIIEQPIPLFTLSHDSLCVNHTESPVWTNLSSGINIREYVWEIKDLNGNIVFNQRLASSTPPPFPFLPQGSQINGWMQYDITLKVINDCDSPIYTLPLVIEPLPVPNFNILPSSSIFIGTQTIIGFGNSPPPNGNFYASPIYTDTVIIDWGDATPNWTATKNCGLVQGWIGYNNVCFPDAIHNYALPGLYNICLTAINSCGDSTICDSIEVYSTNIVSSVQIDTPYACVNECINFTDNSTYTNPSLTEIQWWWDVDPNNLNNYILPGGSVGSDSIYNQSTYSSGSTICHKYSTPGVYFVMQQMKFGPINGLYDYKYTLLDSVIIYPEPIADFQSPLDACKNDTISFIYNASADTTITGISGQIIDYVEWTITDPLGVSANYPNYGPNNLTLPLNIAGVWQVELEVVSNSGCIDTEVKSIVVHDLPTADFSVIPDSSCAGGDTTQFDGSISGASDPNNPIVYWSWNFDDPPNQWLLNQNQGTSYHSYTTPRVYFVTLIVEDDEGCRNTKTDSIYIVTPIVAFANSQGDCIDKPATFDGSLSTISTDLWEWDFDMDGNYDSVGVNTSHIYNSPGWNLFRLKTTKYLGIDSVECNGYFEDSVYIYSLPQPIFSVNTACLNDSTAFNNISQEGDAKIISWEWNLGDSSPFRNDSNFSHLYANCDTFQVTLKATDSLGCVNISNPAIDVVVACLPTPLFTVDPGCDGTTINYIDDSSPANFPITNWNWTINNGTYDNSADTSQNPNFLFNNPGTHQATLVVSDANSCSDSIIDYIEVFINPVAIINPISTVCQGNTTFYNNNSSLGSAPINNYQWDFDDGNGSNQLNPQHNYSACGVYNIQLNITDTNNCTNSNTTTAVVNCNPFASFVSDIVCEGDSTHFTDQSTVNNLISIGHSISSRNWFYGGVSSSLTNPAYIFNNCGNNVFNATLTIFDDQSPNCSTTITNPVSIACNPTAILSTDSVCQNEATWLKSNSLPGGTHAIDSCFWSITGGNYNVGFTNIMCPTQYVFDTCGQQAAVTLKVITSKGCSDSISSFPYVWCNPIANFTVGPIQCKNTPLPIINQSVGVSATIDTWNWNFGINSIPQTSTNQHDTILYTNVSGYQPIYLDVVDTNGCYDNYDSLIFINNQPIVTFDWKNVCANQPTEFTNLSSPTDNGLWYYNWIFSDGNTSSDQHPTYTFNLNSTIGELASAILVVTDSANCRDTFNSGNTIEIHPLPIVSFIADDICEGDIFEFIDNSQMSPNQIFTDGLWVGDTVWIFNGNILSQQLPIWNYSAPNPPYPPNIYGLTLTQESTFISEYNNQHCSTTHSEPVEILVMPKITYSETFNPPTKCGNNVNYSFDATHQDVNSWIYEINDPWQIDFIDSINTDFNYTFLKPFNYPFSIILNNLNGCSDTITDSLHIFPNPIALFNPNDTAGCEKLEVPFRNLSYILDTNALYFNSLNTGDTTFIESYYWDFGNGNSNGTGYFDNPTNTYIAQNGTTSTYYPTLTVTTNEGCSHTYFGDSISVYPTPIAYVIHPDQYGPVNPGQYIFNGTQSTTSDFSPASTAIFDYIWVTASDSIWNKLPTPDSIAYQYQSNSDFQGGPQPILYDVCLILIDNTSQYRCADTFCIAPGLYVDYFKGLYVPNALTPNSSTNETSFFLPKGKSLKEYHLQIFDKWGGLLWETTKLDNTGKPEIGWDGTSKGVPVPQGTYVWKIHAIFSDGTVWQGKNGFKSGPIYLVR